jgi:hypothetical protein
MAKARKAMLGTNSHILQHLLQAKSSGGESVANNLDDSRLATIDRSQQIIVDPLNKECRNDFESELTLLEIHCLFD